MNMRGPARARSLALGTYWVALKEVQFADQSLALWSSVAAMIVVDGKLGRQRRRWEIWASPGGS